MRVTKIEIKNFRAFYGTYQINLDKSEKNLLVYGENGNGKSSLYLALRSFLESSEDASARFENHQNIFIKDDGYTKLHLQADSVSNECIYKWSRTVRETENQRIIDASKAKGFLDYKALLKTHNVNHDEEDVNVFVLLIDNLLANTIGDKSNRRLADDWDDLRKAARPRRNATTQIAELEEQVESFNNELTGKLAELQTLTSEILNEFGYNVILDLGFDKIEYNRHDKTLDNQQISLKVKLFDRDLAAYHSFLNEAKLSAIALSIYFAAFLIQPTSDSDLKILALDDVLIGLDMSNRFPVLDILEEHFSDYQSFLMTYDKAWYEIVKKRPCGNREWEAVEFYFAQTDECEIPVYMADKSYLDKARKYFNAKDYKACVIYLRSAFEAAIKQYCDKNPSVRYCENPKDLRSDDFWVPIKTEENENGVLLLKLTLVDKIELYRSIILNPLSHDTIVNIHKQELANAIKAVEELQNELNPF